MSINARVVLLVKDDTTLLVAMLIVGVLIHQM
jgi:hypothetical protein